MEFTIQERYPTLKKALDLEKSLPSVEIQQLRLKAQKLLEARKELIAFMDQEGLIQICQNCQGGCCGPKVLSQLDMNEYLLMLLFLQKEQRNNVISALSSLENNQCPLLSKEGCLLPSVLKPRVCLNFFCGLGEMGKVMRSLENGFISDLDILCNNNTARTDEFDRTVHHSS